MPTCAACLSENPDHARFCSACGSSLLRSGAGESRRLVTIVFCDLEASTPLASRLDAESFHRIVTRYFDESRAVLERHGGTVEKFIGDAVMAVFGVPTLHEDDALRAVRAAMELHDALDVLNAELERDWGVRLRNRIGVNSGEVVAGDPMSGHGFVSGTPVILASRLEGAAEPGTILLGDGTYQLVRDAVTAQEVALDELKGLGGVRAHRLIAVIPGVAGHARRLDSPLVDRERETALLRDAFERMLDGRQCQMITVLGVAGVGKSRLVDEFLGWVLERAATYRTRCLAYGEGITFRPIIDIVTRAAGLSDEDSVEEAREKIAGLLSAEVDRSIVAQQVSETIGIGETPGVAEETFWAIRSFLEALARRRPLVLLFDDIQFGEPTFLELVEHIADWSRDVPIMLICIARPDLLDAHPSWGGGKLNATSLLLEPLTGEHGDLLVQNLLGSAELARSDREHIVEAAGGNPLFVEEILSMLIDDGVLTQEGDRWVPSDDLTAVAIPPTISALLAARLDRLSPDERTVIEHAAVVGKQFSVEALAGLLPEELSAGIDASLTSLVRKELLKPTRSQDLSRGHFDYRHILIRDAAYDSIPKNVRAALHERYALWLEDHPPGRRDEIEEILGYHLEQAHRYRMEVGPFDEHVSELARGAGLTLASAGRRAAIRGDASAAVNLLGRAARLLPRGDATRLELLPSLYDSLYDVGALEDAASLLPEIRVAARQRGDRALETRVRIDERWWEFMKDPGHADLGALRRDLEAAAALFRELDDHWNLAIVLESLATVHWVTGAAGAMLNEAERGLSLARQAGNRRMVARTASNLASALLMGPSPYPEALERMDKLADDLTDDRLAQSTVRCSIAIVLASLGRFDRARGQLAEARAVFADLGQRRWLVNVSAMAGLISLDEGLLAEAEREIGFAYGFFRDHRDALNAPGLACDLARALLLQGRDDEANTLALEAAETGGIDLEPQVRWRGIRALVLARRGEVIEAEVLAREALALVTPTDFVGLRADASTDLAQVLISMGRRSEAERAIAESLTLYGSKGDVVGAEFARGLR